MEKGSSANIKEDQNAIRPPRSLWAIDQNSVMTAKLKNMCAETSQGNDSLIERRPAKNSGYNGTWKVFGRNDGADAIENEKLCNRLPDRTQ